MKLDLKVIAIDEHAYLKKRRSRASLRKEIILFDFHHYENGKIRLLTGFSSVVLCQNGHVKFCSTDTHYFLKPRWPTLRPHRDSLISIKRKDLIKQIETGRELLTLSKRNANHNQHSGSKN